MHHKLFSTLIIIRNVSQASAFVTHDFWRIMWHRRLE